MKPPSHVTKSRSLLSLPETFCCANAIKADTDTQINEGKQFTELIFGVDVINRAPLEQLHQTRHSPPKEHEENHLTAFLQMFMWGQSLWMAQLALRQLWPFHDCSSLILFLSLLRNMSCNKSCCCGFSFCCHLFFPLPHSKVTRKVPIMRQSQ